MLLQNLQAEFADALKNNEQHLEIIIPTNHLAIYYNNIITNFTAVLQNTYPLLVKLVGEDYFNGLSKEYIYKYPCSSHLDNFGEYFSDFILTIESLQQLPYLHEVAQLEWLCHSAYYAAEPPELNDTLLKKLSPDQYQHLNFVLHPACELKQCHYPILRIIDLCHSNIDETINLAEGGMYLLITRQQLEIKLIPLKPAEFKFLHALKNNLSLAEALEIALATDAEFNLNEKLPLWIKEKTIVDYGCLRHDL